MTTRAEAVAKVKDYGVVGAGGAGFPSYVKMAGDAEIVLVNAAECEPLLHKDKEILSHYSEQFFAGLQTVMDSVGARRGIVGIKAKHHALIEQLKKQLPERVEIGAVGNFYPAGDEITLIYETTGRVVGAGELPGSQGVVVNNVETLYNIGKGGPVITKFLNVTGEVEQPVTVEVPIGISFREVIPVAKPKLADCAIIEGGPMMGKLVIDLDKPVSKTTGGLILLPKEHILIRRFRQLYDDRQVTRVGKAACDQCMICTELCPRYLLGHPVQPHKAMRSLLFSSPTALPESHALYCCECNLCSLISCPEGLAPSMVCAKNRRMAREQKLEYQGEKNCGPHPMVAYRRTPSPKLKTMLDLNRYNDVGPLVDFSVRPTILRISLQQHIGKAAVPVVGIGDVVTSGQKIATVEAALGAEIHASAAGRVEAIENAFIVLRPEEA